MKETYHVQCVLEKDNARQVSWIPAKIANPGNLVNLKNDDGSWDLQWRVVETNSSQPSSWVLERKQDYKKMRSMTDI